MSTVHELETKQLKFKRTLNYKKYSQKCTSFYDFFLTFTDAMNLKNNMRILIPKK